MIAINNLTWRPAFVDREVDLLFGFESLPAFPPAC